MNFPHESKNWRGGGRWPYPWLILLPLGRCSEYRETIELSTRWAIFEFVQQAQDIELHSKKTDSCFLKVEMRISMFSQCALSTIQVWIIQECGSSVATSSLQSSKTRVCTGDLAMWSCLGSTIASSVYYKDPWSNIAVRIVAEMSAGCWERKKLSIRIKRGGNISQGRRQVTNGPIVPSYLAI